MKIRKHSAHGAKLLLPLLAFIALPAMGQLVVKDDFTGAVSTYDWKPLNGACLTAGGGTLPDGSNASATSFIKGCQDSSYYSGKLQVGGYSGRLPDPIGKGALRLTNGDNKYWNPDGKNGNSSTGSVVSNATFPTNLGVHITYTTATYGGNGYLNSLSSATNSADKIRSGADGLAFFLMDGNKPPSIGSYGGSLGYSCAQGKTPGSGVDGGYLAVAADEYGNFSNPGDSTADGPGARPGSIVVRGAGSITWTSLNATYNTYYPDNMTAAEKVTSVQNTCKYGTIQNYSGATVNDPGGATVSTGSGKNKTTSPLQVANGGSTTQKVLDYALVAGPIAFDPAGVKTIFNQEAVQDDAHPELNMPLRGSATKIAYDLVITQDGLLSFSYSLGGNFLSVISKQPITANNGPLPDKFRFGFTSGTGGGSNVHEILCFKASQVDVASDSIGTNVQQSSKVQAGSQVYFAYYHPKNSWGQLKASSLAKDTAGNPIINAVANWDVSCVLTGSTLCAATNKAVTAQAPSNRNVFSWDGTGGITFAYANMSAAEQTAIGGTTDGATRIAYLRGDRTNEATATPAGTFRGRDGVLGDIRNSSPTWVGYPAAGYSTVGRDRLYATDAMPEFGAKYNTFSANNLTRLNVVYVGANDGMLHGFRAGAYDSALTFDATATTNDGKEVLAYVPAGVVNTIHNATTSSLDFSATTYSHNAYVDATPGTGDLYYNNNWHTWLVGGLGAGGNAGGVIGATSSTELAASATGVIYALDITDPTKFAETSTNASSVVLGEWNSSTITCVNDTSCKDKLGSQYGTPIIKRMHNGNWAAIFGNGRNSVNGAAGVFIMLVAADGGRTFRYLDTGASNVSDKNGIDYVTAADLDGDDVVDYLYAGDLKGNVWRFDVTDSDASKWASASSAMFVTPSAQPITTAVTYTINAQVSGSPRVMVQFGTGRQTPQTASNPIVYAAGAQSLYGIWDWDLTNWNTKKSTQFLTLTAPQAYTAADLTEQTLTTTATNSSTDPDLASYRTITQTAICWKGQTICADPGNTKFGWKINFSSNEQIIYNPQVVYGLFFVNTTIPVSTSTVACDDKAASGFSLVISPDTGGAPGGDKSIFDPALTAAGYTNVSSNVVGVGYSATGTTTVLSDSTVVFQTSSGTPLRKKIILPCTVAGTCPGGPGANSTEAHRITWIKLR